jgi:hypothetical protein
LVAALGRSRLDDARQKYESGKAGFG